MSDLAERLHNVGLRATSAQLDDLLARATRDRWSPAQLLEHIVDLDEKDRVRRSLERRFADSHLGRFKPMLEFDWGWPTAIDRDLVGHALAGDYLADARNIVLVAPQGLGKTMIAQNLAHQAILKGRSVLFLTAAQLLLDLGSQESSRALDRRLHHYAKVSLLVLDEVGYLAFDNRNADLLFQVVSRRYEKKSLVLTTNLAFSDWPTVFPSATCATAVIDRVIHHADVIVIEGESYRLREAKEHAGRRRTPPLDDGAPKNKKK
jgi:DNA replication protein DnaC